VSVDRQSKQADKKTNREKVFASANDRLTTVGYNTDAVMSTKTHIHANITTFFAMNHRSI